MASCGNTFFILFLSLGNTSKICLGGNNNMNYIQKIIACIVTMLFGVQSREWFDPFENVVHYKEEVFRLFSPEVQQDYYKKYIEPFAGSFKKYSARDSLNTKKVLKALNIKFNIIQCQTDPTGKPWHQKIDVGALQAHPDNQDAVFQVASNFNCLEGGGYHSLLSDYVHPGMYVQGEAAATSAMPGLIARRYYLDLDQLNLLARFNQMYSIGYNNTSGYIGHIADIDQKFGSMTDDQIIAASYLVDSGVQENVAVTGGWGPTRNELLKQTDSTKYYAQRINPSQAQRINQVFTAALNAYNNNPNSAGFKNLARIFLHAAYRNTISYAWEHDKKKVFLTLVGGGVFQNKKEWIMEAIQAACNQSSQRTRTAPLEVTLIVYHNNCYQELKDLVQKTGGQFIEYQ